MSILLIIILLFNRKEKQKHKYEIELLSFQNQKIVLNTQLEIQEQTFQQISREIHDHIGQRLTLARLYINGLSESSGRYNLDALHESSALIEEAISDLKHLSRSLTANLIRDEGLFEALKLETERVCKITGINAQLNFSDDLPFMSVENELIIYRIIQEAIQNILKHAKATEAYINFKKVEDKLLLEIRDNGKGFDLNTYNTSHQNKKSGLQNLKKRAELLQGELDIISEAGKGTCLYFQFPNYQHLKNYAAN